MAPLILTAIAIGSAVSASTLEVDIEGLRNSRGVIRACLTQDRLHFPNCRADSAAVRQSVNAGAGRVVFVGVTPGDYAVILFHDENANRRLDTLLGIPKEGFGFSRNPVVRFGAPRYDRTDIEIAPGFTRIRVRLQYLL